MSCNNLAQKVSCVAFIVSVAASGMHLDSLSAWCLCFGQTNEAVLQGETIVDQPVLFFSLVFLLLACFFADHFYIAGQMYRVHSAADQLVNAVVLSFWGAAIENHLGHTTLVCFSDCRQDENTYIACSQRPHRKDS